MNKLVELHLIVEITPEAWRNNIFEASRQNLADGIVDAADVFREIFPKNLGKYWEHCASVKLNVYNQPKSIHPYTLRRAGEVARYVMDLRPDVLYFDDLSLRLAPVVMKLRKLPIVMNIHDPRLHGGEKNWRIELSRALVYPQVDHFILHSEFSRNEFLQRYRYDHSRTSMVPFGVLEVFREWLEEEVQQMGITILFFGRISPYKGVEVFIEAARKISAKISNCTFVIAGQTVGRYKLPELPRLENNGTFQIFKHYLLNKELVSLVQRSTVVACPYLTATQSGVVLTSYAFSKPVVVTNVGGLAEFVWDGETGRIVPPNDADSFANGVIDLLSKDKSYWSSKIAEKVGENLNWETIARQTCGILEKVSRG
jgi:glycosyltransferase involved in cell wall biosynthesis